MAGAFLVSVFRVLARAQCSPAPNSSRIERSAVGPDKGLLLWELGFAEHAGCVG